MIDFIKEGMSWLDVDLVRNEVSHIVQAADPDTYPDRAGLRYYLDIEVPEYSQSSTFEQLIRMEGREKPPIISAGAEIYEGCTFRLETLIAGQLTLSKPEKGQSRLSVIASLTSPYLLREIITPEIRDELLPIRVAMRAGLALRDFVVYEHRFFSRYQAQKMQFLTWQPAVKTISPRQEEYLYFLINMSPLPTEINLRVRITYSDAPREVVTKKTIQGLISYQVVCAPVGVAALGLTASNIIKYEVWLADENQERFTEVRTFVIDASKRRFERFVLFANSLGGFDTLRLLGKSQEETDIAKSTAVKERETGKGLDYSELQIIAVKENSGMQVSTGFFESDQELYVNYLRELFLSECILEDTDFGYEALNLITDNLAYKEDNPGLMERSFQFRRTYSDTNFSRLNPVAPAPARPTSWRGKGNIYLLDAYGKRTGLVKAAILRKYYLDTGLDFIPLTQKANVEGDQAYLFPSPDISVVAGETPFPSAIITRIGTYTRNNCGPGEEGSKVIITIAMAMFGGEKAGDSDILAEAEWSRLNTQQYANLNGSCEIAQNYIWPVTAGHFHYRSNMPTRVALWHIYSGASPDKGNSQALQSISGTYIFPVGSNDLDFPVEIGYYFGFQGFAGESIRCDVYNNGVLKRSNIINFPSAGNWVGYLFANSDHTELYLPAALDRFLIKLTLL